MRNVSRIIVLPLFWFTALAYGQVTATPVFTLPTGTYTMPTSSTITDATAGASILWCFTGSGTCTPATSYTGSIYIDPSSVDILCANATASGFSQSPATCATYTAASPTGAAPPTFSPVAGSYSGTRSVTLSTSTAGANIYYTTDGSTPDYTSTLYTGPILVSATTTLHAIAGVIGTCTGGTAGGSHACQSLSEQVSQTGWKKADCQSPGNSTCTSDNPGGAGVPKANSSPGGTILHSGCLSNGGAGPCMNFTQTPQANQQTNVLWPHNGTGACDKCTWLVENAMVLYGPDSANTSAHENDLFNFDSSDDINFQFGMQCTKCTSSSAVWDIGGTTNVPWTATGVTQEFAANEWHHIIKEDHWVTSELTSKPCSGFPCLYWTKLILDGVPHNLQAAGACGQTSSSPYKNGCTFKADTLETGFGSLVANQFQIDGGPVSSPVSLNDTLDEATFTAFYDPSAVASAAYTIGNLTASVPLTVTTATPTLVSAYLTTPGSVNTMTAGGTLQFSAFCHYSSGPDLNCTMADTYGDAVTVWSSSNTALATIGAVGSASPGLVTAVAAGALTIQATIGSAVTPAFGLTISSPTVTLAGLYLATTGGVTGLFVGSTTNLIATCTYSDGSNTNCTSTDSHGNVASSYASSSTGHATVNATTGLVTGVAAGTTNLTAHAGSFTSPNLGLMVVGVPSGVYSITIIGPVQFSGTVKF